MLDYQFIIFDVDGTLLDSGSYLNDVLQITLENNGYEELVTPELLARFVGVPLYDGFINLCNMTDEECSRVVDYFDMKYKEIAPARTVVLEGVEEMLSKLKENGKTLLVATNGSTENAGIVLSHCGLDSYFTSIRGLTSLGAPETKADVITGVMNDLDIKEKNKVVMVGDRDFDIVAAKECGIDSIGILHGGYGTVEELSTAGADYIVKTSDELSDLLIN